MAPDRARPLSPDELGRGLAEVFAVLGPLYRRVSRRVEDAEAIEGLSIGVRAVLESIAEEGPQTVPRIAEALVLSRQFIQRMVDSGRASGLLELEANPRHRRSPLVRMTPAGKGAVEAVKAREHAALAEVGGEISGAEVDATLKVLRALSARFE